MGYFKQVYSVVKNIENLLPHTKKSLIGMEIELEIGKTTIKNWNYNRDSKVVLSLTNGTTMLLENLPLKTLEDIENELS